MSMPTIFWVRSRAYACTPSIRDPNTLGAWFPCSWTGYATVRTLLQNPSNRLVANLDPFCDHRSVVNGNREMSAAWPQPGTVYGSGRNPMKTHFVMMANYNNWANARLFREAG